MFKWALPVKLRPPPSPKRARWSFFWPPKTSFWRVLQNQVHIDFDNENHEFCDENSNNFDDQGDANYQKTDKYHGVLVKIFPY